MQTLPAAEQAFRAINTFKDEYLLDYINVEELGIHDRQDILCYNDYAGERNTVEQELIL